MSPASVTPTSPTTGVHPLSIQIRVHQLNDGDNLETVLFRVQKGWIVKFKLGPTLFGRQVKILTNYPENLTANFDRLVYRELSWKSESVNRGDDTALYCDLTFERAGSFHYFFVHDKSSSIDIPNGSGFILVEPTLTLGTENDVLPLDCIVCQTYLAKCLGPFSEWGDRLRVAAETGYNMVHITPVQELGKSLSSYSLRNQLKLNPMFNSSQSGQAYNISDVSKLVDMMKQDWKVLTISDIVLNHTANESDWLKDHPDATYNLANCPHLRPAYLLDRALWHLGRETAAGQYENTGLPPIISEEIHLDGIRTMMYGVFLCQLKIYELYIVDVEALAEEFKDMILQPSASPLPESEKTELKIIQDPDFRRLKSTVDMNLALQLYASNCDKSEGDVATCCKAFQEKLQELNNYVKWQIEEHLKYAIDNVIKAVRYERLQSDGPRLGAISEKHPFVAPYFYQLVDTADIQSDEKLMYSPDAKYIMAHNGWVMTDNPLRNFADPGSNVYLRRELIAWGDSVKLRYGTKPEDSPYLWDHMTKYVEEAARTFHGLRLDNCHSTPIHVAEYLIDKARVVRPDLYLIAELFTSNEGVDNIFVNRLGITSLVREAMSAPVAYEQGRLVYRYGGSAVGAFVHPVIRPLTLGIAHAIFMDVTHDNPSIIQKRSVQDTFPTAAMVNMACCATGSTRGYDELVPHHIHVVNEGRYYLRWTEDPDPKPGYININTGIIAGKRAIIKLHKDLGYAGFSQVFVDQHDSDTVVITRHCPATHTSVILVARTSFSKPVENTFGLGLVKPLSIPGVIDEILFEGELQPTSTAEYAKDETFINGLSDYRVVLRENIGLHESRMVEEVHSSEDGVHEFDFTHFPPGSVIAFRVSMNSTAKAAVLRIRTSVAQFGYRMRSYSGHLLQRQGKDFESIVSRLSLGDLNRVLFRCDEEEKNEEKGFAAYNIPRYGSLVYCGLQGVMSELMSIHLKDDLGHPLCENLRAGDWLATYIAERLIAHPSTQDLGQWFKAVFNNLNSIPRYLVPCYFDSIITGAYSSILTALWRKMSDFVNEGSSFVKALALGSVILGGAIESAPLPDLSPSLELPLPPVKVDAEGKEVQSCITLSAGLPHFSVGYMRIWGRDTFIALRGLFLIPGRYQETRYIILAFAACLRHGLIPNLMDRGVNARFNCRDAVWWWLQTIQDYTKMVEDGHVILQDSVSRLYPTDDSPPLPAGAHDQRLCDVMQEALQIHFQGLKFRERNAGYQIDNQMIDNGFNNEIGVDLETGFVFGGNADNAGTWMDKMGSSEKARNKGVPATPRDGSAIELVGLSYSALRWLSEMFEKGLYPCTQVERLTEDEGGSTKTLTMTFKDWADLIKKNFEKHFWVDIDAAADDNKLINKRGIYKDTCGASSPWCDFQLRPNLCIAMVVAPDMFTPQRVWTALSMVQKNLLGPLGMKTLDPSDWQYNGNYNNDDDSDNKNLARGFNYHQGPEWLWPVGYFLRAKLHFAGVLGQNEFQRTLNFVKHTISNHFKEIQSSKWKGLPELTNKDGAFCPGSCTVQAWSHACLLEVLYEIDQSTSSRNSETSL